MTDIITVIGAKGKVGIEVLKQLSQQGIHCRAITRDLKNTIPLPYVSWIGGDLTDTPGIINLLAGSTRLFLNTDFSPAMAEIQENVIRAAKETGIKHITYLSYGLLPDEVMQKADSMVHKQHIQVEQALIHAGLHWTILRPSAFMQNWLLELSPDIRNERKIYEAPGDGKLSYIDTRDLAEVIVETLSTHPEKHSHKIYELTGSEPVSFYQISDAISHAIDDKVTYIAETPEESKKRFQKKGYPEWAVNLVLFFAQSQREGKLAYTTSTTQ